jgi:hypothetical protein
MRRRDAGSSSFDLTPALRYELVTGYATGTHYCGAVSRSVWRCEQDETLPPCTGARAVPGGASALFLSDE